MTLYSGFMQTIAFYSPDDLIEKFVEVGALKPLMVCYCEEAAMALKNFSLRKPSLAQDIFITHDYKSHLGDFEMQPLNMLDLARTILTNIQSESLESVVPLVLALQNEFIAHFQLFLDSGADANISYCRRWVSLNFHFLDDRVEEKSELANFLFQHLNLSYLAQLLDLHPSKDSQLTLSILQLFDEFVHESTADKMIEFLEQRNWINTLSGCSADQSTTSAIVSLLVGIMQKIKDKSTFAAHMFQSGPILESIRINLEHGSDTDCTLNLLLQLLAAIHKEQ